jgi:hypothetical protein
VGNRDGTLGVGESRAGAGPHAEAPVGGADLHPEPDTPALPSAKSAAVSLSEPALSAAEWSLIGLRLGQRSGPHFVVGSLEAEQEAMRRVVHPSVCGRAFEVW